MYKLFSALFVAVLAFGLVGSAMAAKGDKKPAKSPEEVFKALDTDGDGFLTLGEFTAKAKPEQKEAKEKAFKAMDKDGKGKISLDDFKAGMAKKGGKKAK